MADIEGLIVSSRQQNEAALHTQVLTPMLVESDGVSQGILDVILACLLNSADEDKAAAAFAQER